MQSYLYFTIWLSFILIAGGCADADTNELMQRNPDLITIARENDLTVSPVSRNELSHLKSIIPKESVLRSIVILKEDNYIGSDLDRIAGAYWFRSPHSDVLMKTLTSQIFDLFSQDVTDLIDETIHRDGCSPIDMFAFKDPAISEEQIIFAQIRDEIYEFHVGNGKEELVMGLIFEIAEENKRIIE